MKAITRKEIKQFIYQKTHKIQTLLSPGLCSFPDSSYVAGIQQTLHKELLLEIKHTVLYNLLFDENIDSISNLRQNTFAEWRRVEESLNDLRHILMEELYFATMRCFLHRGNSQENSISKDLQKVS